ncbi:unnamed protein product [Prorocentrum cordatum]|uniref:Secreted protein n=1 Tax=Prorocentrum cordatum TaxID=2364126 RepID=A0ABN9T0Z9_9DINO|nr:unnamed protein product [Polarella glacialis]
MRLVARDALLLWSSAVVCGPRAEGVRAANRGPRLADPRAAARGAGRLGVSYDQSLFPVGVAVWHNGAQVPVPVPRGLKGEQWPALYLAGCTVDWALGEESTGSKRTAALVVSLRLCPAAG